MKIGTICRICLVFTPTDEQALRDNWEYLTSFMLPDQDYIVGTTADCENCRPGG